MANPLKIQVGIDMSMVNRDLNRIRTTVSNTRLNLNTSSVVNGLGNINSSVTNVQRSLGGLTQSITQIPLKFAEWYVVGGIVTSLINSIKDSVAWIFELDSTVTTMNLTMDGSGDLFDRLVGSTTDFAKALASTVDQGLEAVKIYTNMNETLDSILEKSESAIILNNLGGSAVSVEQAADSVQALQNQFDLLDKDAMRIADTLSFVSANLKLDFSRGINEITRGIQVSGSIAKESGLSLEQYSAILGKIIERTRLSGSTIGSGLRTIFNRIFRITDLDAEEVSKIEGAFRTANVEIRDGVDSFRDMQDVVAELDSKWSGLSETQKSFIAENAAGVRRKDIFLNMMNSWSSATELFNNTLEETNFAAERNEIFIESLAGKMNILKATWQEAVQNTLDSEDFKDMITSFTSLVGAVGNVTSKVGVLGSTLATTFGIMAMFNKNIMASLILNLTNLSRTFSTNLLANWERFNVQSRYMNGVFAGMPSALTRVGNGFKALAATIISTRISVVALNVAFGLGLGLAISKTIQLIQDYVHAEENRRKAIMDTAREIESQLKEVDQIETLLEKKKELEKQEKSSKIAKEELIEVEKQIASLLPETTTGYDSENQAISENTALIEKNNKAKKESLILKAQETIALAGGSIKDEEDELEYLIERREYYLRRLEEIRNRIGTDAERQTDQGLMKSIGENLQDLSKRIDETTKVVNDYEKAENILNGTLEENTEKTKENTDTQNDNADAIQDTVRTLSGLQSQVFSLSSQYDLLNNAQKELQNEGYLSQETIDKLSENFSNFESQTQLSKDGIVDFVETHKESIKTQIQNEINKTNDLANNVRQRIKLLKSELQALASLDNVYGARYNSIMDKQSRGEVLTDREIAQLNSYERMNRSKGNQIGNAEKELDRLLTQANFLKGSLSSLDYDNKSNNTTKTAKQKIDLDKRYSSILSEIRDKQYEINMLQEEFSQAETDQDKIWILSRLGEATTQYLQGLQKLNDEKRVEISELEAVGKKTDDQKDRIQELKGAIQQTSLEMFKQNGILKQNKEQIADMRYDQFEKSVEDLNYQLSVQKELYDQVNDKDKVKHLQAIHDLTYRQINVLEQLNAQRKIEIITLDATSDRYQKLNKDIQDTHLTILGLYSNLDTNEQEYENLRQKQLNAKAEVERKMVEIVRKRIEEEKDELEDYYDNKIKRLEENYEEESDKIEKVHDERIQSYEDDLNAYEKYINDRLNLLEDQYDEEDFLKTLAEERDLANETQRQIDQLALDDSLEARNKVTELTEQLAEQEERITKLKVDKERADTKKSLQKQLDDYRESSRKKIETENSEYEQKKTIVDREYEYEKNKLEEKYEYRKDMLDRQLENEELFAEAQKMLANNTFDEIVDIYEDFEDKFGEGMSTLGDTIKSEFIDNLILAQSTLASLSKMKLPGYNGGSSSSGGQTISDMASWLNKRGYSQGVSDLVSHMGDSDAVNNWVDSYINNGRDDMSEYDKNMFNKLADRLNSETSGGSGSSSSSGGGSSSSKHDKNNDGLVSVDEAGGWDAFEKMISDSVKGSHSKGGKVDYTGLGLLHGSKQEPEYIFNYDQFKDLAKWVANYTPKLPKLTTPQLAGTNGVTLNFDNLINVEGNLDKSVVGQVKNAGNEVLQDLRRTLERFGTQKKL